MNFKKLLSYIVALLIATACSGQNVVPPETWAHIDSFIYSKKNLADVQATLQQLKQRALANNDIATAGRCWYYELQIADKKTEDTLFFTNARFMDSILNDDQAAPLLKAIMHVLKAKRIKGFNTRFYYNNNKSLIASYDKKHDYATMSNLALEGLADEHFDSALQISLQLKDTPVEKLLWLSGDPLTFLFKPTFTDIVYAEWISAGQLAATGYATTKSNNWLSLSQDGLMQLPDTAIMLIPKAVGILHLYKQWMQYHIAAEPEASYFIETLARKYFYNTLYAGDAEKKQYEQYLLTIAQSPYNAVKANGVYQLCLLWNSEAAKYNPSASTRNYYGYDLYDYEKFDTACRLYYTKALGLFTANRRLMDSFPFMRDILEIMKDKITAAQVKLQMYDTQLPGSAIAVMLQYRNIKTLYTRIVRIGASESTGFGRKNKVQYCMQLPSVVQNIQPLPIQGDYQLHNAFLKVDALPAGTYMMLYSDTAIGKDTSRVDYIYFKVTNIAVINNGQHVFILNRKTGFPLQDADVRVDYRRWPEQDTVHKINDIKPAFKKVSADGYIDVTEKYIDKINIFYSNDTLQYIINEPSTYGPEHVYNKDGYDNMEDYYGDNVKLHIFTDRAIYRPGQMVYYKVICITRDPQTGNQVILNKQNLRFPFFQKVFGAMAKKFANQKVKLYLDNPFRKNADSVLLSFNNYGSFSGSFAIPKAAATGSWYFESDGYNFDIDNQNNGTFHVEEYKRPAFELTITEPTNELYLGDSFAVKLKVKSFAGAQLNNVKIKYTVERTGDMPVPEDSSGNTTMYSSNNILKGEAYTNDKGELLLHINDTALAAHYFTKSKNWRMTYAVTAEAVDATGESHEEDDRIYLSNKPVMLDVPIAKIIERTDIAPLYISAKSPFAGFVKKQVEVRLYKVPANTKNAQKDKWLTTDVWLYSKQDMQTWFPGIDLSDTVETPAENQLIWKTTMVAGGDDKLTLPKELLQSGNYRIEVSAIEHEKITGETFKEFAVFDKASNTLPQETASFHYLEYNSIEAGKEIAWVTGNTRQDIFSIYHIAYYSKTKKGVVLKNEYDTKVERRGVNEWKHIMPDASGRAKITHLYIINNQLYKDEETVYLPADYTANPEIIVEQYRKVVAPGSKQTFTVSVKTKNENIAAELMTTMYDATLDKLEKHTWNAPYNDEYIAVNNNWDNSINNKNNAALYDDNVKYNERINGHITPLWWLNPQLYSLPAVNALLYTDRESSLRYNLSGMVAGAQITNTEGLDDVVVVGYSAVKKSLTASMVTIRGSSSLSSYKQPLIIVDGVVFTGDLSKIDPTNISGIIIKGADAAAMYGSRAAGGVLIISTKGPVQIPVLPEPPVPVIRKDFAETAFFYPQVHAGRDGYFTISFTLPGSVTGWKWKMLAHTKKAAFAYTEKTVYSQLPLMVQPAMPRFLYQGDKIMLKSRISNLDTIDLTGTLQCVIEDAITGEDISSSMLTIAKQDFSVQHTSNSSGAFQLTVPQNMLHPLRIKITAATKTFSDGEEHIIPILAKKILVIQNTPVVLQAQQQAVINTPAMPADAEAYGTGLYIAAKPQAALLNALPYLADYPYNCAEQIFNKLLAHAMAIKIMRADSAIQQMFSLSSTVKRDTATPGTLPGELNEQTMPWLQLNHAAAIHQQKLTKLLDTLEAHKNIDKYFEDIYKMQNTDDGGVSWYNGGKSNYYVSTYLLAGFGKLQNDSSVFLEGATVNNEFQHFISKLIRYCDDEIAKQDYDITDIQYLYARSYWLTAYPLSVSFQSKVDTALARNWRAISDYDLGEQGILITATLHYASKEDMYYKIAMQQLESISQLAIMDDINGTRWKSIADGDDLNMQAEESIAKIAEAFEAGGRQATVPGIIKWLLQNKQEHSWSTTKATGEVIGLLNRHQPNGTLAALQLQATINNNKLQVTDDLLNGQSVSFMPAGMQPFAGSVAVQTNSLSPVSGGINYYYFTATPPTNQSQQGISISKTLYRYNEAANNWDSISQNTMLNIADKIKTTLIISTHKQLQYVFIDDKHAAPLEPKNAESGYEYGTNFDYYKSVRDEGMQFFAEKIPAGISTISYETVVSQTGSFTNGPASLQCMYQPSIHLYSGTSNISVKE